LVYMTIVFESSYCNVYGTEYQLRYVYRNNVSGIAVEYITGTSDLYQIWGVSHNGLGKTEEKLTSWGKLSTTNDLRAWK
jgi:hypothetical protein